MDSEQEGAFEPRGIRSGSSLERVQSLLLIFTESLTVIFVRAQIGATIPDRNIRFLQRLSQITESRQILVVVLSYCRHSDTVAQVLGTSCNSTDRLIREAGVSVLSLLFITRKPTGESGKRALLEKVFDIARCPIAIVDDSAEVVDECAGASFITPFHISLAKRGTRVYPRSTVPSFSGLIEAEESLCNWCINSVPNSEE
ncbi:unnamed protein product [Symbiodinium natans]|uniref:Uncharacterized protein n=1 Tax=Symbiodinium natans TaxID=878477 RepID=A0A812NYH6_9DINO|nr:unnamed protein product [Symbiodinium natans]